MLDSNSKNLIAHQVAWFYKQQSIANDALDEMKRTMDVILGKEVSNLTKPKSIQNIGKLVADTAYKQVNGRLKSTGWCLMYVEKALEKALGINITNKPSAYMFSAEAPLLAYYEPRSVAYMIQQYGTLDKWPVGTVAVWNKTTSHEHGHIEIKGYSSAWVSDYIQLRRVSYAGQTSPIAVYEPKKS